MHGIASIVLWVPAFMIPGFLRAAGDAGYTMLASVGSMWLVRVLFAYIFGIVMGYGLAGIWFAHSVLDWIVRSVLYYYRYRSGRWQLKRIKT
ncbi:MAG: MATE family efflux transporter, partial [Oscillospiraceae bacterium]|nr:MATE family efflux transporter [Oscillospiraceae bacterium]